MANECGQILSLFFQKRRQANRGFKQPLREDALRTPDRFFSHLSGYPWSPHYLSDLPALNGLRLHYLDEGPHDAPMTWLCLHDYPTWSYAYRTMLPVFLAAGHRVIAPDMIGFGKSDKPKKEGVHSFAWHRQILLEFAERLALNKVVLVVQGWGSLLGLSLPMENEQRYIGLVVIDTDSATVDSSLGERMTAPREMSVKQLAVDIDEWIMCGYPEISREEYAAYAAPFPDRGHQASVRSFPKLVSESENSNGTAVSRLALDFWQNQWTGLSLVAMELKNSGFGGDTMTKLHQRIRNCPSPLRLAKRGAFLSKHGEAVAQAAVALITTPTPHA